MTGLLLFALVTVGPPLVYGLALVVRSRVQQRRQAQTEARHRSDKLSVKALKARLEREHAAEAERTDRFRDRQPGLPAGWTWPSNDPDTRRPKNAQVRPRRYVCRASLGSQATIPERRT